MKAALLLAASSALTGNPMVRSSAHAATPTSYIDLHLITSFASTGHVESGYLFRVDASDSTFAGKPPKGPRWSTRSALTGGAGKDRDTLSHVTAKDEDGKISHPNHRLMLPPDVDGFLCNEADGSADYKTPAGNSASGVFDPDTFLSGYEDNYVLVPRGKCTFEAKARSAQRLGAAGVVVRNTLGSRYRPIDEDAARTGGDVGPDWANTAWPVERRDYECGTNRAAGGAGWRAEVDAASLDFDPAPYDAAADDALLTGPAAGGSLCAGPGFEEKCPSERCLLTGRNASDDGSTLEACCAWDLHMRMSPDGDDDGDSVPEEEEEDITISALFVTMEHGEEMYDVVVDAAAQQGSNVQFVTIVPYRRWYPSGHYSGILIWALALLTLWVSAYESAKEYRTSWKKISKAVSDGRLVFQRAAPAGGGRERAHTEDTVDLAEEHVDFELAPEAESASRDAAPSLDVGSPDDGSFTISDDANEEDFVGGSAGERRNGDASDNGVADGSSSSPAPPRVPPRVDTRSGSAAPPASRMELGACHAVAFVACASVFLFVLFFFNLDKIIRVVYGVGGSAVMHQILFHPLYGKVASKFLPGAASAKFRSNAFGNLPCCRGQYFKWIDLASLATGYAFGIAWIVIGLTHVQPMNNAYYWLVQDVMGVCFCILVLGLIHINTIMVASVLLFLVFVYDIFYVLLSPLIFGSSVMIDVATGASGTDPTFCEKYPSERSCRGAFAPLPMLMAIPWFNDFRGGFSMLGLGDIVLPGLLISFAARYDSATALVTKITRSSSIRSGANAGDAETDPAGGADDESGGGPSRHYQLGRVQGALFGGYFGPLVIAYGVGLLVAYAAVWTTGKGQPALLYLVPACLGTTLFLGWRRRELSELWSGPRVMKKANRMVNVAGKIPEPASPSAANLASTSTTGMV